ncbi:hypothetical protein [Burkholderia sp. Bp8991]|uniref:hypothetical protein n=1 Tax=Burkholderia sp. Bp8991 TaxID=2184553 RepID=UPI000F591C49|nr:hypothetical protein [Burkholderia sp. Bp8991]
MENHKLLLGQLLDHAYKLHKQQAKGDWQSLAHLLSLKENSGRQLSAEILMQYRQGKQSVSMQRALEIADGIVRAGIRSNRIDVAIQKIRTLHFWQEDGEALNELIVADRTSITKHIDKLTKLLHKLVPMLVDPALVGSDPRYSDRLIEFVSQTVQTITQDTIDNADPVE